MKLESYLNECNLLSLIGSCWLWSDVQWFILALDKSYCIVVDSFKVNKHQMQKNKKVPSQHGIPRIRIEIKTYGYGFGFQNYEIGTCG